MVYSALFSRFLIAFLLLGQLSFIQCAYDSSPRELGLLAKPRRRTATGPPPQPIGLDFGPDYVFATYAHSRHNVTILTVIPTLGNKTFQKYHDHMNILQMGDKERHKLSRAFETNDWKSVLKILEYIKDLGIGYFSPVIKSLPIINNPIVQQSTIIRWFLTAFFFSTDIVTSLITNSFYIVRGRDEAEVLIAAAAAITRFEFLNSVGIVVDTLKSQVMADHGIDITFAILSVPHDFNATLSNLVQVACLHAGIETPTTISKQYAAVVATDTKKDDRILVLEQGEFHFTFTTTRRNKGTGTNKPIMEMSIPMDQFASQIFDNSLFEEVKKRKGLLRDNILYIADDGPIRKALRATLMVIRNNLDAEVRGSASGSDEDEHHEKYPLDLKGLWWYDDEQSAVLHWEDVVAVERRFVKDLTKAISQMLRLMWMGAEGRYHEVPGEMSPMHEIDAAIIVTDQAGGFLLKRALREVLGEHVPIHGGRLRDVMTPAEGVAILGLKRRENWENLTDFEEGLTMKPPVCDAAF